MNAEPAEKVINILHVEDEHLDALYFQEILKKSDHIVIHADQAKKLTEARTAISHKNYDAILLDLTLPDSTGLETLKHIHLAAQDVPIIALTASQDDRIINHAIQYGADDYLIKDEVDSRLISRAIAYAIDRKKIEHKLKSMARTDMLTGLKNRHAFEETLNHTILRTKRNNQIVALFFIDLDLFKNINDLFGHHCGDHVLKKVSQRLTKSVRQQDVVSRIGGDEFVIIFEDIQSEEMATTVAQKIISTLQKPIIYKNKEILITASIGIHIFTGDISEDTNKALKYADLAMYTAKHRGRNTIAVYKKGMPSESSSSKKSQLDYDLRSALNKNEFFLEYQPQFDIFKREPIGAEALIRWRHPQHGVIPPGKFISDLENSGQILPIGEWILRTACAQWVAWIKSGKVLPTHKLSINISPRQCQQFSFVNTLKHILLDAGLSPFSLSLELTESLMLEDNELIIQLMHGFKELGITLSLDDFGIGFSSLSYLAKLPIDRLKIDRYFVNKILYDSNHKAIVSMIISLANNLGMDVIAEGVDQQEKINLLHQYGCNFFQGYILGVPTAAKNFSLQLNKHLLH